MDNIRKIYVDELNKNNIKLNIAQEEILSLLVPLHSSYNQYLKKMDSKLTFFRNISMRKYTPKGIYFWGKVGTGKTMLIDLFYNHLNSSDKLRIHYQSFMLKIHKCILDIKQKTRSSNIIKEVAISISKDFKVIYIDEFYVNDITDAMIINNLFTELFKKGIIILITSNFSPEDLYKDGLQRDHFIPFIELLKEQMNIFQIASDYDYRTHKLKSINSRYYIFKEAIDSQKFILENFMQINNDAPIKNIILDVNGRELLCPITSKDTVVFTFDQLCRTPLGVSDYILICQNFHIIFISEIPQLSSEEHNELRRFIHLIDTIYEYKRILICSAKTEIDFIYIKGKWHFEFLRTASRLKDMQSEEYLNNTKPI